MIIKTVYHILGYTLQSKPMIILNTGERKWITMLESYTLEENKEHLTVQGKTAL